MGKHETGGHLIYQLYETFRNSLFITTPLIYSVRFLSACINSRHPPLYWCQGLGHWANKFKMSNWVFHQSGICLICSYKWKHGYMRQNSVLLIEIWGGARSAYLHVIYISPYIPVFPHLLSLAWPHPGATTGMAFTTSPGTPKAHISLFLSALFFTQYRPGLTLK